MRLRCKSVSCDFICCDKILFFLRNFLSPSMFGKSILFERVYRDCVIFVNHKDTMADLVE